MREVIECNYAPLTVQNAVVLWESLEFVLGGKDADGDHAPGAAESVHTGGAHGVVDLPNYRD